MLDDISGTEELKEGKEAPKLEKVASIEDESTYDDQSS